MNKLLVKQKSTCTKTDLLNNFAAYYSMQNTSQKMVNASNNTFGGLKG